jgi:enterochelin esterase-like enzyme
MLLVAPSDGLYQDGSGYLSHSNRDYEAWITNDILGAIRRSFPFVDQNSSTFIAGLSMGGYGALRLGAKHPELFRGISAHSAITDIREMDSFLFEPFPAHEIDNHDHDVLHWMEQNRNRLPPLRFDCGTNDQLIQGNRRLHGELQRRQIPHQYLEFEGDHSWPYWRTHLKDSLLFFESILAGEATP